MSQHHKAVIYKDLQKHFFSLTDFVRFLLVIYDKYPTGSEKFDSDPPQLPISKHFPHHRNL